MALKYEDKRGRTVTVVNVNGNMAELNNGDRVALERLNDVNFYTKVNEGGDSIPQSSTVINNAINENNDFMSNSNSNTNVPKSRYEQLASSGSIGIGDDGNVAMGSPLASMNNVGTQVQSGGVIESHNDNLRGLGKEVNEPVQKNPYDNYDPNPTPLSNEDELLAKYGHQSPPSKPDNSLSDIVDGKSAKEIREEKRTHRDNTPITPPKPVVKENPLHLMFDKAKKVYSLNINLKLNEKIPSKEVIKMMEENFDEISAIDYYSKDIYKKLMEDPSIIETQVKEAIKKYIRSRK